MNLKNLWDIFTDRYSFLPIHPQYYIKGYTNNAIDIAVKYSRGILVDIGCGRMPYREKFLKRVEKYIGVDSPDSSKYYDGKIKPNIYADATSIPLPNGYCDTVLLSQVLEHLPDPDKSVKEAARILKKDGNLIVSTIQSYPLHDEPYDFYRYTKYGLKSLLERNGFRLLMVREDGNVFVQGFQGFNIYLMLILKNLIKNSFGKVFALMLTPIFLTLTFISNLITYPLTYLDKHSNFRIIITVVAKR